MVSEKKIFSHYQSMEANGPRGVASLDPRGLIGRISVVDHYTLLHTKIYNLWASWFQRRRFYRFSHYKSMGAYDRRGVANLDPRGMVGSLSVGDHLTSLHT